MRELRVRKPQEQQLQVRELREPVLQVAMVVVVVEPVSEPEGTEHPKDFA